MATIIDSYVEANQNAEQNILAGSVYATGQAFTADGSILDSAQFFLIKTGSPTGSAFAKIYATTGTFGTNAKPTGSALATSDAVDISTVTSSYSLISFAFTGVNAITLTNGVNYCVVVSSNNGDGSNLLTVGSDSTSATHAGNSSRSSDETTWSTLLAASDLIFYLYGVTPPATGWVSKPTYFWDGVTWQSIDVSG